MFNINIKDLKKLYTSVSSRKYIKNLKLNIFLLMSFECKKNICTVYDFMLCTQISEIYVFVEFHCCLYN